MRILCGFIALSVLAVSGCATPDVDDAPPEVVYFRLNGEGYDEEGTTALTRAGRQVTRNGYGVVMVQGHTDTSADFDYNLALSARRADAVRRALIARGVPPSAIEVRAMGQSQLAVETGDGVAEPANRRAEIEFAAAGGLEPLPVDTPYAFPLP